MQALAQGLASLGRNGDSTLVHMSPKEVQGLQQLALAKGGSLTVNPHTGLPEAFDLGDIIGPALGIGASLMGLGPLGIGLASGLGTFAATRDPGKALTSGVLSGGLSGLMGGISGMGEKSILETASNAANQAGDLAAKNVMDTSSVGANLGLTPSPLPNIQAPNLAEIARADDAALLGSGHDSFPRLSSDFDKLPQAAQGTSLGTSLQDIAQGAKEAATNSTAVPDTSFGAKMGAGFKEVGKDPLAFAKAYKWPLAATGLAAASMLPPKQPVAGPQAKTGYAPKYTYNPQTRRYEDAAPAPYTYYAAGGGSVPNTFPQSNIEQMAYSKSSANPMPTNVVGIPSSDYDARINQQGDVFTAAGGGKINAFKLGGSARADAPYQMSGASSGPYGSVGPIYGVDSPKVGIYQNTDAYAYLKGQMNKMPASMLSRYAKEATDSLVQAAAQEELYARQRAPQGYIEQPTMNAATGGTIKMADGGFLSNILSRVPAFYQLIGPSAQPAKYNYDSNTQRYTQMASGGIASLGEYAAGGKLLQGPGDGMSDSIPAVIKGNKPQRAALAQGEFVVPADVVSHLGNGSTDAGAKRLYAMMDKVRHARTGTKKQGRQINPEKFMPA